MDTVACLLGNPINWVYLYYLYKNVWPLKTVCISPWVDVIMGASCHSGSQSEHRIRDHQPANYIYVINVYVRI